MNRHLVAAFALALTVGASGVASAQGTARPDRAPRTQQDSAGRRGRGGPGGMLLRGITLTADQQARVAQLRDQQRKEFDANRPQRDARVDGAARAPRDTTGMAARRAQMEQRRAAQNQALRGILNPSQQAQFDKNVAEAKAHEGDRRRGGPDGQGRDGKGRDGKDQDDKRSESK